ncbi:MAG: hypothetical protein ACJAXJ_004056 [Colwellia sp.]|jgi:hypothetical protein
MNSNNKLYKWVGVAILLLAVAIIVAPIALFEYKLQRCLDGLEHSTAIRVCIKTIK